MVPFQSRGTRYSHHVPAPSAARDAHVTSCRPLPVIFRSRRRGPPYAPARFSARRAAELQHCACSRSNCTPSRPPSRNPRAQPARSARPPRPPRLARAPMRPQAETCPNRPQRSSRSSRSSAQRPFAYPAQVLIGALFKRPHNEKGGSKRGSRRGSKRSGAREAEAERQRGREAEKQRIASSSRG